MKLDIRFTSGSARNTFYFLQEKYGTSLKFNEKNFSRLAKLAILTESSAQASIDQARLEKLLPQILADEEE